MTTVRLVPNPDISTIGPTVFKTERNQHEVCCEMCGRIIYIAEDTLNFEGNRSEVEPADQYRCELCKEEFNDQAW